MYSTIKDQSGDSIYISVDTLVQPKKHTVISAFSPYATGEEKRRVLEAGAPLSAPPQESMNAIQKKANQTGLPDQLKTGIENLSGISLENTRVHYNSSKPVEFQALAYTQGTDIHIGPGQEKYLPHEAWHVVQQRQGRVKPESQIENVATNNDWSLEREADLAGSMAAQNGIKYAPLQTPVLQSNMIIQRMEDPDDIIYNTLMKVHNRLRKIYESYTIPKPSAMAKKIREFIKQATDKKDAYQKYAADAVKTYLSGGINASVITAMIKDIEEEVSAGKRERDERLKRIRESESTEEQSAKKRTRVPVKVEKYLDPEKAALKEKLESPRIQQKMFRASALGYRANRAKSTETVKQRAELNALTESANPLSTADMAMVQASYRPGAGGEQSLLLEKGPKYQVTMSRSGGQEIHQLGPYLPGIKKSVQEIIEEILKNTKLSSTEQAEAMNIRDPEELAKWVAGKNVSDKYIEKIRAMRHLLAIEKHRGEEISGATSLEHRSAVHGFRDITEYPERTPLGPSQATVELKLARAKRLKSEGKKETDIASDFSYIPSQTHKRALESTTHFLTSFMQNPKPDPEAGALVKALLEEQSEPGEPSQQLVDAFEGIVRTPTYTGFGGQSEEVDL